MAWVKGRHLWTANPYTPPIEPCVVDLSSGYAVDLRSCRVPSQQLGQNQLLNLAPSPKISTMPWPSTAGQRPTWISGALGAGLTFDGGDQVQNTTWIPAGDGTAFTMAALFRPQSVAAAGNAYTFSNTAAATSAYQGITYSNTGTWGTLTSDGSAFTEVEWGVMTANHTYAIIYSLRSTSDVEGIALNLTTGVAMPVVTTIFNSPAVAATYNIETLAAFQNSAGISNRGNLLMYGAFYWHRPMQYDEMLGWALNPFGMLRPAKPERRFYVSGGSAQTITGVGFANSQSFGAGAVDAAATITGAAFTNTQAFGTGDISQPGGAQTITGVGFTNGQSFGAGVIAAASTITGVAFTNSQAFGAGAITAAASITGVGFTDPDSFGAGVLSATASITGVGFTDPDSFGTGAIAASASITGVGFTDPDSFGAGAIAASASITGVGFTNSQAFGAGSIDQAGAPLTIDGVGFVNPQAFGTGAIDQDGAAGAGDYLITYRRRRRL